MFECVCEYKTGWKIACMCEFEDVWVSVRRCWGAVHICLGFIATAILLRKQGTSLCDQ